MGVDLPLPRRSMAMIGPRSSRPPPPPAANLASTVVAGSSAPESSTSGAAPAGVCGSRARSSPRVILVGIAASAGVAMPAHSNMRPVAPGANAKRPRVASVQSDQDSSAVGACSGGTGGGTGAPARASLLTTGGGIPASSTARGGRVEGPALHPVTTVTAVTAIASRRTGGRITASASQHRGAALVMAGGGRRPGVG